MSKDEIVYEYELESHVSIPSEDINLGIIRDRRTGDSGNEFYVKCKGKTGWYKASDLADPVKPKAKSA